MFYFGVSSPDKTVVFFQGKNEEVELLTVSVDGWATEVLQMSNCQGRSMTSGRMIMHVPHQGQSYYHPRGQGLPANKPPLKYASAL